MKPWLIDMNPEQAAVIAHTNGPLFVPAQAGTGKTRALVGRIARLIREENVDPKRILAVTFSSKAAGEMNSRLTSLGITSCRVGTWHSLALQIHREDRTTQSNWTVDEHNRFKVNVKEAMGWKHHKWTKEQGADLTRVLGFIGFCKANAWGFDSEEAFAYASRIYENPRNPQFTRFAARKACAVFQTADELTHEAGILTFDDMLLFACMHLHTDDNGVAWAARWDYVLQDEAQDANAVQMAMAMRLAEGHRNYMVVGDPAQSIYGFRGSDPQFFMDFESVWQPTTVYLSRNYRSGSAIVGVANDVIRVAKTKLPVDMVPMVFANGKVAVVPGEDLDDEARSFVQWVREHVSDSARYSDCTALFRTNAQSRALEEALLGARIPYVVVGGISFYERKEVKDLLGYLRVAAGRDRAGDAVRRCINAPFRFLGAKFVQRVMDLADCDDPNWPEIVRSAAQQSGIQARQEASAEEWASIVCMVRKCVESDNPEDRQASTILSSLVHRTGFLDWLTKDEGEESIENSAGANVRELIRVAERFATVGELLDYIDQNIAERAKQKVGAEQGNRVLLMSIHRSKGLEWPFVWVVGCNDGVLPHAKGEAEEERRLMYVAVTRAKDELVLSWVKQMAQKHGVRRDMVPSQFLFDAGLIGAESSAA